MPEKSLQETKVLGNVILGSLIIFWSHQELHWGLWEQRGGGTIGAETGFFTCNFKTTFEI
jgi:hypothetical protein